MLRRICFLSSLHPALDKRVFREARSLSRAGYDVWHVHFDKRERLWKHDDVQLLAVAAPSTPLGRLRRIPRLYRRARRLRADCYHCNEIDSWIVGLAISATSRCKVVFDIHERYPAAFAEDRYDGFASRVVTLAIRVLFSALSPLTDSLILAVPAVADDLPSRSARKQTVVHNYPSVNATTVRRSEGPSRSGVVALHQGLMSRRRGWPQLLAALRQRSDDGLSVRLVGGFGDSSEQDFLQRRAELGLEGRVHLSGWVDPDQLADEMAVADIGLVLFQNDYGGHDGALPHKLFDYMLAGLPVIAPADSGTMSRMVMEADCGLTVDTSRPAAIAAALDRLAGDPAVRRRMGLNGQQAVLASYNWQSEEAKLLGLYAGLWESQH